MICYGELICFKDEASFLHMKNSANAQFASIVFLILACGSLAAQEYHPPLSYPQATANAQTRRLTDGNVYPTPQIVAHESFLIDETCCQPNDSLGAINQDRNSERYPSVNVTGFFHLDSAWFTQDDVNRTTLGDINDGLGFRRARIAAKGNVAEDIQYILEFDFAQS